MGFQQLTLNANNFSHNSTISSGDFDDIAVTSPGKIIFSNSDTDFAITHTFDSPQILTKLVINFTSDHKATHYLVQASTDGINYITISTVSGLASSSDQEYLITQPLVNPIKYKSFRFSFTQFQNSSTTEVESITAFIPDNLQDYRYKDYNVGFDDSLIDMASWKNSRYNGSKLTGTRINFYTEGDGPYPFGLKPIIENKVCALFVGSSILTGDADNTGDHLTEIKNHSYVTIDTILLINVETNKVEKISHEQFNETEEKKTSFRRFIHESFPEGSKIVTKIINNIDSKLLKESHRVKFNQGLLMKLYSYTANTGSNQDDGVFGGYGVRESKGNLTQNVASGSSSGGGLFSFGSSHINSRSIFNATSIKTVDEFPSELSFYSTNIGSINSLLPLTASNTPPPTEPLVYYFPNQNSKL